MTIDAAYSDFMEEHFKKEQRSVAAHEQQQRQRLQCAEDSEGNQTKQGHRQDRRKLWEAGLMFCPADANTYKRIVPAVGKNGLPSEKRAAEKAQHPRKELPEREGPVYSMGTSSKNRWAASS